MRVPKYRQHTTRDRGFVEWQGKRYYLPGPFDSFESREAYRRFLREHALADLPAPEAMATGGAASVAAVASGFLDEAAKRYGTQPRSEYGFVELVLRYWVQFAGQDRATDFGPRRLRAYRDWRLSEGDSPRYVNNQVNRIKRAMRWAVSEEIAPASAVTALEVVTGLEQNAAKREPVEWRHVKAILPYVSRTIRAMILLQWYTGARSRSICWAAPGQFDQTADPWLWRPVHKTERTRGTPLILPVGPKGQSSIAEFMDREPAAPLFSPREVSRSRAYGVRYKPTSYRRAVERAIQRANVGRKSNEKIPHWFPYQLRHARGQLVRDRYGAEAAQAVLGHETLDATEIYTSRVLALAVRAAKEMG